MVKYYEGEGISCQDSNERCNPSFSLRLISEVSLYADVASEAMLDMRWKRNQ
jgi:hypothetical protein